MGRLGFTGFDWVWIIYTLLNELLVLNDPNSTKLTHLTSLEFIIQEKKNKVEHINS